MPNQVENFTPPAFNGFKIFKTIKLGRGIKDADDYRCRITNTGMKITNWGNKLLGNPAFSVTAEETEVDLIAVTVSELGFKNRATLAEIYARAKELGFELCKNEVGPALRLQYEEQPNREWLLVGMEPICDSNGDLHVFYVENDDYGMELGSYCDEPKGIWYCHYLFVFVMPRK